VKSSKNRFTTEKQVISLVNPEDCGKPIELDLSMTPDFTIENVLAEEEPVSPSSFTPNTVKNLKQGDVIELRNIYYDYNKWDIRSDAARDLNALAELMEKYPTMEIELSSHTDIRGSDSYNEDLSDKRAKSAVAYLAKKGIAQARMTARGFGESRPKNDCRFCTEDDHQENRRTEVRIVKLERK
jgi:outer membrane protein OmpA-like peptidoglycan-associated protein